MDKKSKILIIGSCIAPVIFMFLYSQTLPSLRIEFLQDSFTGVLITKYRDSSNHNAKTLVIKKTNDSKPTTLILIDDTTFYNTAQCNDSLVKIIGGQEIKVIRQDSEFVIPITFRPD